MIEGVFLERSLGLYLSEPQAFVNEANTAALVYAQSYYKQHGALDIKDFDTKVDKIVKYIMAKEHPALAKIMQTKIVRKKRGRSEGDLYIGLDSTHRSMFENTPGLKLWQ